MNKKSPLEDLYLLMMRTVEERRAAYEEARSNAEIVKKEIERQKSSTEDSP